MIYYIGLLCLTLCSFYSNSLFAQSILAGKHNASIGGDFFYQSQDYYQTSGRDSLFADSSLYFQALRCKNLESNDLVFNLFYGFGRKGYATGTQGTATLKDQTVVTLSEFAVYFDYKILDADSLFLESIQLPVAGPKPEQRLYKSIQINSPDTFYVRLYNGSIGQNPSPTPFYSIPFTIENIHTNNNLILFPKSIKVPNHFFIGISVNKKGGDDTLAFFTSNPDKKCGLGMKATYARLVNANNYMNYKGGWQTFSSYFQKGYDADIIFIPNLRIAQKPASRNNYIQSNSEFVITPNPANDYVNIHFETEITTPVSIKIIDLTGKLISESSYNITNTRKQTIELFTQNLIDGIYLIILSQEGNQMTRRLLINR